MENEFKERFNEIWNRLILKHNITVEDFHIWIEEENKKKENMSTVMKGKRKR